MSTILQDLKYAVRALRKSPGFAVIAILTLALGIGANTGIFTLLNALLYRELPVPHPKQLVELRLTFHNGQHVGFSLPMFQELQRNQKVFSGMLAWSGGSPENVEVNGKLARNNVFYVSGDFYSQLGQRPELGRLIEPSDTNFSAPVSQVAVISDAFWRTRFGADPDVLGKQIVLEGRLYTVIGVTRKTFAGLYLGTPSEISVPLTAFGTTMSDPQFAITSSHYLWLSIIGRLKDGVSIDQARSHLSAFWPAILAEVIPSDETGERREQYLSMRLFLTSAAHGPNWDERAQYWKPLFYLMGIVALMLLAVCVNVASLMLARGVGRIHEMSIRLALGAKPLRIAMQTLLEGLLLSIVGALLGLVLAFWGTRWMFALLTRFAITPVTLDLHPDLRVLGFTTAAAVITALLFGIMTALRAAFLDPGALLRQDSRTFGGRASRMGQALIIAQISLSLMLVLASALFTRSFWNLRSVNVGFDRASVLNVWMLERPGGAKNLDVETYYHELMEHISGLPGVRAAGLADLIPGGGQHPYVDNVAPMSAPYVSKGPMCTVSMSSPGFFNAVGMKILQGRDFSWSDGPHQPRVAIVSAALAKRLFPQGSAIGAHVRISTVPDYQNLEIVGIVNDARLYNPRDAHPLNIFMDELQQDLTGEAGLLFVRTAQNPLNLAPAVSQVIDSFGHQFAARTITLQEAQGQALIEERLSAMISIFFGGFALLLACIGLYGLISQSVARRTREIGIRMAIGAQPRNIMQLVLRQAVVLLLAGVVLGVLCSIAASRLVSAMLYGVSPDDILSIVGVSLTLLSTGLIASYIPARRAMRVDPIVALRYE